MSRTKTGSAYLKHGVVVVAINLRPGSMPKRWVSRCPPRPDGVPVDLIHGRAVAVELQRRYDAGLWDPQCDAPPQVAPAAPQAPVAAPAAPQAPSPAAAPPTRPPAKMPTTTYRVASTRPAPPPATEPEGEVADTVLAYARQWVKKQTYESAPKDKANIEIYLAPAPIASMPLTGLKAKHILAHIQWLKAKPSNRGGTLAPRTVRSAYDVLRRALDAAVIDELLPSNPCAPVRGKLPSIEDKNPAARQDWLYSRDEIVRLISDPRIQEVRRVSYALQFLTGLRVGELAVLRWKDYDPAMKPLARLTIARAKKSVSKREAQTKTSAVKLVPVHPALAPLLDAWKATGWKAYRGHDPAPGDLVVPNQFGEVRNTNRHNRDLGRDCKRLGIVHRHQHAMRHTFITHVQDDGGDGQVIRWVTHAPPRTAFDSYTRGQWLRLCAEIVKLAIKLPEPTGGGSS